MIVSVHIFFITGALHWILILISFFKENSVQMQNGQFWNWQNYALVFILRVSWRFSYYILIWLILFMKIDHIVNYTLEWVNFVKTCPREHHVKGFKRKSTFLWKFFFCTPSVQEKRIQKSMFFSKEALYKKKCLRGCTLGRLFAHEARFCSCSMVGLSSPKP